MAAPADERRGRAGYRSGRRRLAGGRSAGGGEAKRGAGEPDDDRRQCGDEHEHRDQRGRRVELRGGGAERRHQAEIVLLVPEPELARRVEVREARARQDEGGETEQQKERPELRHSVTRYLTSR